MVTSLQKIKKAANLDGLETELAELENCEEMRDEFNLFNLKKAIRVNFCLFKRQII